MADTATNTYILEDEQGNEYEIDSSITPASAAENIRKSRPASGTPMLGPVGNTVNPLQPGAQVPSSQEAGKAILGRNTEDVSGGGYAPAIFKALAPMAADVLMTMALPETALLKVARIPGFSTIANSIVSKWGPEMLRRVVGGLSGAATAGVTSGPEAAIGYGALSLMPPAAASQLESMAGPGGALRNTLVRGTGGAFGGAAGVTTASLAERGQMPHPLEVVAGAAFGGGGEAIAGAPAAIVERQIDPRIHEWRTRFPQLADIPDALLMNPDTNTRRILDSLAADPLANPVLAGASEDVNKAVGDIAREKLGVRPSAEALAGEVAPNLDAIQNAANQVVRRFEVPRPAIAEPALAPGQVVSEMTPRLDAPQPLSRTSALPAAPSATIQGEGVKASQALQARHNLINEQGQAQFGRMMDRIRSLPETPVPVEPLQKALAKAKDIAGPIIIPENRQGAMRTAGNVAKATAPLADADELAALSEMFPELMTGFGNEAAELTNLSKLTLNQTGDLLKGLSRARQMYSTRTGKKIVNTLIDGVWDTLEQSDMPLSALNALKSERAAYTTMAQERDVIEKALRRTSTKPELLGRMVRGFNPDEMTTQVPNTIFNSLSKSGYDVEAGARNLLVNNLSRQLSRADQTEIPKILRSATKSPLLNAPELRGQAQAWEAFLANPENEKKAKQYFDVLTGGGPNIPQEGGKQATALALQQEAFDFAKTLPPTAQEAIGRTAARNILAKSVKPVTPVTGGPQIMVAEPSMLKDLQSNAGGFMLLPKADQDAILEFATKSTQALDDSAKVADTIAKLYEPGNYSGMANLFRDYFKGADPRKIAQVKDMLSKVPGGKQAWEDFATSQLSTNMFEGNDFSAERVIRLFEDDQGKMIPKQTLDILTSHLPEDSHDVLQEIYQMANRILNIAPGRANPLYSALRTGSSMGKTAAESTGVRSLMTRVIPSMAAPVAGAPGKAAIGAVGGMATSMVSMLGAVLAPEALGKTILNNGETLRKTVKPALQLMENFLMQTSAGVGNRLTKPKEKVR